MSHSMMVPVTAFPKVAGPAESVPECTDGDPGAAFLPDEAGDAGTLSSVAEVPPPDEGVPDPLQRLIEALSGISAALAQRPETAAGPQDAPSPGAGVPDLTGNGSDDPPDLSVPLSDSAGPPVLSAEAEGSPAPAVAEGFLPRRGEPGSSGQSSPDPRHGAGTVLSTGPAWGPAGIGGPDRPPVPGPAGGLSPLLPQEAPAAAMVPDMPPYDPAASDAGVRPADPHALLSPSEEQAMADTRPARAVPVARQIAEALVTARGEVIEIALAPEELGRLRMVVSGPEQAPHVTVWVERPEVLEQLRRNGTFLQECLGDAGMEGASFEFRGDTPGHSRKDRAEAASDRRDGVAMALPPQLVPASWTPIAAPARLDIRI